MYLNSMEIIAQRAGQLLLRKRKSGFEVGNKSGLDPVTDADKASETLIIEELQKLFPSYSFLAEEGGWAKKTDSEFIWVIDPLDGTANFIHGFPHYSVSIALIKGKTTIAGVVYNPVLQELFSAQRGQGAFLNEKPITVSAVTKVQDGLFVTGFSGDKAKITDESMARFNSITRKSQGVRRIGSGALDLCYVACGRLDGFWEKPINSWDIAAGALILEEAGGKTSGIHGETYDPFAGEVLGTNGLIHHELIHLLQV